MEDYCPKHMFRNSRIWNIFGGHEGPRNPNRPAELKWLNFLFSLVET